MIIYINVVSDAFTSVPHFKVNHVIKTITGLTLNYPFNILDHSTKLNDSQQVTSLGSSEQHGEKGKLEFD
jgi:hypothetical protein